MTNTTNTTTRNQVYVGPMCNTAYEYEIQGFVDKGRNVAITLFDYFDKNNPTNPVEFYLMTIKNIENKYNEVFVSNCACILKLRKNSNLKSYFTESNIIDAIEHENTSEAVKGFKKKLINHIFPMVDYQELNDKIKINPKTSIPSQTPEVDTTTNNIDFSLIQIFLKDSFEAFCKNIAKFLRSAKAGIAKNIQIILEKFGLILEEIKSEIAVLFQDGVKFFDIKSKELGSVLAPTDAKGHNNEYINVLKVVQKKLFDNLNSIKKSDYINDLIISTKKHLKNINTDHNIQKKIIIFAIIFSLFRFYNNENEATAQTNEQEVFVVNDSASEDLLYSDSTLVTEGDAEAMDLAGEQVQPKMYQKPTIEKDTAKNEILIKPKKKDKPSKAVSSKGTTTSSELNKSSVLGSSRQKKVTKSSLPLTSESGTYFYNIKGLITKIIHGKRVNLCGQTARVNIKGIFGDNIASSNRGNGNSDALGIYTNDPKKVSTGVRNTESNKISKSKNPTGISILNTIKKNVI